jgi:hypothetical protein
MNHVDIRGSIGGSLFLRIAEEIQQSPPADGPDGLNAWRAGKAFHLIPSAEESSRRRFEADPIIKGVPAGQFRKGIHYGEICTMRRLCEDGFSNCLYENYELFRSVSVGAEKITAVRTNLAAKILGQSVIDALCSAAAVYNGDVPACVPDVMAWRADGGIRQFRFVESKNERRVGRGRYIERVKRGQLLGLSLLALSVPNADIHIYRWLESETYEIRRRSGQLEPRVHECVFRPSSRSVAAGSGSSLSDA